MRDEGGAVVDRRDHPAMRASSSDPLVRAKLPLLAKVMPFVGHTATRARGTVGGSLANADPAAEIALVAVDARRDAGLSRRRHGGRMRRRGFLHRADDDGAAAGRAA